MHGGGGGWAGLDLEFPQGQTRVYSLKMLFFMDLKSKA